MKKILFVFAFITFANIALAETDEFGGHDQRFKGTGDNTPPQCTIEYPKGSSTPFFIEWSCADDVSDLNEIRSELWLTRIGSSRPMLLDDFLGFPASALIDEQVLGVTEFTDGLPISIRLIVKDRAGNAATSEIFTIRSQDVTVDSCDLTIVTDATESTGSTTGLPSMSVVLDNADVNVVDTSTTNFSISTTEESLAGTCEIDTLCSDKDELTFNIVVNLDSSGNASGLLAVSPGSLSTQLNGTSTTSNSSLTRLEMTGTATVEGAEASVTFVCTQ